MSVIYFHIGLPKTATTYLQNFFYHNQGLLLEEGIYYPSTIGVRNHIYLSVLCSSNSVKQIIERNNLKEWKDIQYQFTQEINPYIKTGKSLLLSNETLSSRVNRLQDIEKLKDLSKRLSLEPKIILYLRRQDKLLISLYSTMIKAGKSNQINLNLNPWYFNYFELLKRWETVFGKGAITVRIFENSQLIGNDIIKDFLKVLKISHNPNFILPQDRNNFSLGRSQLAFLAKVNSSNKPLSHKRRKAIIRILSEKTDNKDKIVLSKIDSEKILDKYKKGNAMVLRKYFNQKEDNLFEEPFSDIVESKLPFFDKDKAFQYSQILFQYL